MHPRYRRVALSGISFDELRGKKQIGVASPNTTISELPAHTIEVRIDNGFSHSRQETIYVKKTGPKTDTNVCT